MVPYLPVEYDATAQDSALNMKLLPAAGNLSLAQRLEKVLAWSKQIRPMKQDYVCGFW